MHTLQEQFSETEANAICETFGNKEILKGLFVSFQCTMVLKCYMILKKHFRLIWFYDFYRMDPHRRHKMMYTVWWTENAALIFVLMVEGEC